MHFMLGVYDHIHVHVNDHADVDVDVVMDVDGLLFIANKNKFTVKRPCTAAGYELLCAPLIKVGS